MQQIAGVDIKRRGAGATQADLNIRGGTFDQTLLLIDGIKLDDAQTGHHTLNFLPPPQMIERIEIIKGPAARAYGQNAFTGAINIVTKKETPKILTLDLQQGNYDQTNGSIFLGTATVKKLVSSDLFPEIPQMATVTIPTTTKLNILSNPPLTVIKPH